MQRVGQIRAGRISVSAVSADAIPRVRQEIGELLRERHRLGPDDEDDFSTSSMAEMTSMLTSTQETMTLLLMAIAMVSLLVGGIGVMNIMLVSVTERTREIGIRMAVGAQPADILAQILVEALVLAAIGGALGGWSVGDWAVHRAEIRLGHGDQVSGRADCPGCERGCRHRFRAVPGAQSFATRPHRRAALRVAVTARACSGVSRSRGIYSPCLSNADVCHE